MKRSAILLLSALATALAGEGGGDRPGGARHRVTLASGTQLVGRLEPAEWRVATAFGSLTIPVTELHRVRFGRRADPERLARIAALLEELGATSPERRRNARAALAGQGAFAVPDLKRAAAEHSDKEIQRACSEILAGLDVPEDDIPPDDDVVETNRFTLQGTVNEEALRVTVPELGPITVRRRDVAEVKMRPERTSYRFEVTGNHVYLGEWLETGIEVRPGDELSIRAQGAIAFPEWGDFTIRPDGAPDRGMVESFPLGSLVGRVGDEGPLFRVGSRYRGAPPGAGRLKLAVLVQIQGQPHHGSFRVRIDLDD
jgi:hypothetical protein